MVVSLLLLPLPLQQEFNSFSINVQSCRNCIATLLLVVYTPLLCPSHSTLITTTFIIPAKNNNYFQLMSKVLEILLLPS